MLIRAATWLLVLVATILPLPASADAFPDAPSTLPATAITPTSDTERTGTAISDTATSDTGPPTTPPDTVNDFLPEDRGIGECISALPKPGCGSESRGGWAQTAVFGAIMIGISFIVWRIVVSARRARRLQTGTPT